MNKIIADIKNYIIENGIKQKFLAEKTGISEDAICSILSGKRRLMTDEFFDICDAINVSPDLFYVSFCKSKGSAADD